MSSQRLAKGTRFIWKGVTYEVIRNLPDNRLLIEDLYTAGQRIVEMRELVDALFASELVFVVPASGAKGKQPAELALDDYPGYLVEIARSRLEAIQSLIDLQPAECTRAVVEIQAEKTGMDTATLYRWIELYLDSGRDIRALIPAYVERGGKGKSRLPAVLENIVDAVLHEKYLVREKVSVQSAWYEVTVRVGEENALRGEGSKIEAPSLSTVYRRVEALGMAERFIARRGKEAARRELTQFGQSERPTQPLQRVEFDNTLSDLIVLDDDDNLPLGRMNLTTELCVATGYPVGYYLGFEPPSIYTLAECAYHGICPKPDVRTLYGTEHAWLACGMPLSVAVDNGKEFLSRAFEDACGILGIQVLRMPVRTPYFKGPIERFFRTLNTGLWHTVPGTTFSNPTGRGDYKSMAEATIYLSEVDKLLHIYLLDVYAEQFHRGLNGIPARLWENATGGLFAPRLPRSADELRILLGRFEMRIVHHYGVELEYLRYNHSDLAPLRERLEGKHAKVRFHPGDLSKVHVFDPFENRYIEAPALAVEYTKGLSLWKHRVILTYIKSLGEAVDIEALGRAKRKIQEIVERGRDRKRAANRSKIGRWKTAGKPSRELSPKAIEGRASQNTDAPSVRDLEIGLLGVIRGGGWSVEISPSATEANNAE